MWVWLDRMQNYFAELKEVCRIFANSSPVDVSRAAELLDTLKGQVYGRICSSPSPSTPPKALTSSPGRKMVFTMGYDGLLDVLRQKTPFDALMELGFLKEFIDYDVRMFVEIA